jgi:hypothetical protein
MEIDGEHRKLASWLTEARALANCVLICQCHAGTTDIIELIIMLLGSCVGFLIGNHSQSRADRAVPKLMASSQELERTRAALDYIIILGLMVTLVGAFLQFIIPEWRLLLISAGGMLLVVIALWYGRNLKQP